MIFNKITGTFNSTNGEDLIKYYAYTPLDEVKGIVQVSHGMCEYIERYEYLAEFFASQGILLCGNDHLGHGNSVLSNNNLGYFAAENGWTYLYKDLYELTKIIKNKYPNVPYFLLGHSMGSFVARAYISEYGENINGAIISGTSGGNALSKLGKIITKRVIKSNGEKYRSEFLDKLMFGTSNNRIKKSNTKFDWLTRDEDIVNKYVNDEKCNYLFTASATLDLINLLDFVSSDDWAGTVPKKLPILIISGDADPIGNYGKGVKKVYNNLIKAGVSDVEIKLYKEARHEVFNETNKDEVNKDVLKWILKVIG